LQYFLADSPESLSLARDLCLVVGIVVVAAAVAAAVEIVIEDDSQGKPRPRRWRRWGQTRRHKHWSHSSSSKPPPPPPLCLSVVVISARIPRAAAGAFLEPRLLKSRTGLSECTGGGGGHFFASLFSLALSSSPLLSGFAHQFESMVSVAMELLLAMSWSCPTTRSDDENLLLRPARRPPGTAGPLEQLQPRHLHPILDNYYTNVPKVYSGRIV
jgi:hypothetical protein